MSDLISRREALSFLRNWERVKDYGWGERNIIKAAINEIESLPSAQPEVRTQMSSADCISRQDAIEAVMDEFKRIPTSAIRAKTRIEALPSVQPKIIRCKDCKYACIDPERESDEIYCSENDFWKDDDFYCGYAERRTEE